QALESFPAQQSRAVPAACLPTPTGAQRKGTGRWVTGAWGQGATKPYFPQPPPETGSPLGNLLAVHPLEVSPQRCPLLAPAMSSPQSPGGRTVRSSPGPAPGSSTHPAGPAVDTLQVGPTNTHLPYEDEDGDKTFGGDGR